MIVYKLIAFVKIRKQTATQQQRNAYSEQKDKENNTTWWTQLLL